MVGELPNTKIGSERMRHSQIDQRCGIAALNTVSGGNCSGGEAAKAYAKINCGRPKFSYWLDTYRLTLPQVGCR